MTGPFCIYAVTHTASGRCYIGSSNNRKSRWYQHRYWLRHNGHHCKALQRAWNRYGEAAFRFEVLEELTGSHAERAEAELRWIRPSKCYNSRRAHMLLSNFENSPATRNAISAGLKRRWSTKETRLHQSKKMKERWTDPAARAVYVSCIVDARQSAKARAAQRQRLKDAWANPDSGISNRKPPRLTADIRQNKAEKMRAYWSSPEGLAVKARRSEKLRAYWADSSSKFRNRD